MFRHLVMFKFKTLEDAKKAKELLGELPAKIDVIRTMELGIDELRRDYSYDLAIVSTFDSKEDYLIYDNHPEHDKVRKLIASEKTGNHNIDYYID